MSPSFGEWKVLEFGYEYRQVFYSLIMVEHENQSNYTVIAQEIISIGFCLSFPLCFVLCVFLKDAYAGVSSQLLDHGKEQTEKRTTTLRSCPIQGSPQPCLSSVIHPSNLASRSSLTQVRLLELYIPCHGIFFRLDLQVSFCRPIPMPSSSEQILLPFLGRLPRRRPRTSACALGNTPFDLQRCV